MRRSFSQDTASVSSVQQLIYESDWLINRLRSKMESCSEESYRKAIICVIRSIVTQCQITAVSKKRFVPNVGYVLFLVSYYIYIIITGFVRFFFLQRRDSIFGVAVFVSWTLPLGANYTNALFANLCKIAFFSADSQRWVCWLVQIHGNIPGVAGNVGGIY